jgi:small multidrug resistance family-3 protein
MNSFLWYFLAAVGEITGCFSFWAWLRMHKTPLWTVPGTVSLVLFAMALTRIDASHAARAYAAYGGVYILSSLLWLWAVENTRPDRWDILGASVCLIGTTIILFGPRQLRPPQLRNGAAEGRHQTGPKYRQNACYL